MLPLVVHFLQSQVHRALAAPGQLLHQFLADIQEGLVHVPSRFGARLVALYFFVQAVLLLLVLHELVAGVAFVGKDKYFRFGPTVHFHFFEPDVLDVGEGVGVVHIVHHNDSISFVIVGFGNSFEALLTGGVPDLHLDELAPDGQRSG